MSEKGSFEIGSLVWGKMEAFPPWPGQIVEPSPDMMRPTCEKDLLCVYFFGSKYYAWLKSNQIRPYEEDNFFKESYIEVNQFVLFRKAIEEIEKFIKNGKKGFINSPILAEDLLNQLGQNSTSDTVEQRQKKRLFEETSSSLDSSNNIVEEKGAVNNITFPKDLKIINIAQDLTKDRPVIRPRPIDELRPQPFRKSSTLENGNSGDAIDQNRSKKKLKSSKEQVQLSFKVLKCTNDQKQTQVAVDRLTQLANAGQHFHKVTACRLSNGDTNLHNQ